MVNVWTEAPSVVNKMLLDIAASDTVAIAVGLGGTIIKSTNGVDWTICSWGRTNDLCGIGYNPSTNRFIAGSLGGYILKSDDDGATWSESQISGINIYEIACDGGNTWVIGTDNRVRRSTDDGVTWSGNISAGFAEAQGLIWNGSNFFLTVSSGNVYVSPTGASGTWTTKGGSLGSRHEITFEPGTDNILICGLLSGVSDTLWLSNDNLTNYTTTNLGDICRLYSCAYIDGYWVACGENLPGEYGDNEIFESSDRINWTTEYAPDHYRFGGSCAFKKTTNRVLICGGRYAPNEDQVGSLIAGIILYKDFPIADDPGSVYLDSCQRYYDATDIGYQYPTNQDATISRSYYRVRQTQSIALASGGYIQKDFTVDYQTIIMGAAVYLTGYPASEQLLFQMRDGSSEAIGLYLTSTGILKVKNGSTTFLTGTTAVESGRFIYVELKATIDNSDGVLDIWMHNPAETYTLSVDGQDTNRTPNGIIDNVRWCGPGSGSTYITSLYCRMWTSARESETPLGNIEIHAYKPIQDASNIGCLPNVGAALSSAVDEVTPVLDDYVYLSAADSPPDKYRLLHEPFVFPNPETAQTILAAQIVGLLANGNADSPPADADFSFFWGYGSAIGNGDVQTVVADNSWLYYTQGYVENPATSASWSSESELNEFTWGVEHE